MTVEFQRAAKGRFAVKHNGVIVGTIRENGKRFDVDIPGLKTTVNTRREANAACRETLAADALKAILPTPCVITEEQAQQVAMAMIYAGSGDVKAFLAKRGFEQTAANVEAVEQVNFLQETA